MSTKPGLFALQSLFMAFRIHGNVEMGKRVAEALMQRWNLLYEAVAMVFGSHGGNSQ
uniref:Uncharacterized protein n=1 Tax=Nelumbo nucifera TaxID=4432 RepID=A0A822XIJ2_NELNU|nr:TPA_asm: hypothetical protein HUJ06_020322 [Nelumbo nucifera]